MRDGLIRCSTCGSPVERTTNYNRLCYACIAERKREWRSRAAERQGRKFRPGKPGMCFQPPSERQWAEVEHRNALDAWRHWLERAPVGWLQAREAQLARMGIGVDASERFRMRYRNDPSFREREIARVAKRKHERGRFDEYARNVLSGRIGDAQMRSRVGYGRTELIEHLVSCFELGMTMAALLNGSIHIDHNEPVSWFDLSDPDQFRRLWRLENLQPMWKSDNCRKGARTVAQWRKAA